jgi:hypothetical protein
VRCIETVAGRLRAIAAGLGLCALSACHSPMPRDTHASTLPERGPPPGAGPASMRPARTIDEYKLQAATRLVDANPAITYLTPAQNPLLAIPILEIEVDADGGVRRIEVLREPTQAADTVQIAIDAVHRAAPFGDATHLPRPWKFTEVFLFDEERRFKPRVLD